MSRLRPGHRYIAERPLRPLVRQFASAGASDSNRLHPHKNFGDSNGDRYKSELPDLQPGQQGFAKGRTAFLVPTRAKPGAAVPWMGVLIAEAQRLHGVDEKEEPTFSLGADALEYVHQTPNPHAKAWCAALMSYELHNSGYPNPRSAASIEWLTSNKLKPAGGAYYGAIMVFKDYSDKELTKPTGSGHISSLAGIAPGDFHLIGLGGNQGNTLRVSGYQTTSGYIKEIGGYMHFEGFFFPADYNGPFIPAPTYPGAAVLNEKYGIHIAPKKKAKAKGNQPESTR